MEQKTDNIEIIRSKRRTLAIQITDQGTVVVRAPLRMKEREIGRFLEEKADWIEKHRSLALKRAAESGPAYTEEQLGEIEARAKTDIRQRVERFANIMGVSYGKVTIRRQKTRWGSCSAKGNLNFNCLLEECPPEVRDYVVVHELAHRVELNHSNRFWSEVGKIIPGYKLQRDWLKENGARLIQRLEKN